MQATLAWHVPGLARELDNANGLRENETVGNDETEGGRPVPSMSLKIIRTFLTAFLAIEHNFSKKMETV
jgi:hypothetical protein